ncbi:hypothetical protein EGW08_004895, partial [Elysia chlorotica]
LNLRPSAASYSKGTPILNLISRAGIPGTSVLLTNSSPSMEMVTTLLLMTSLVQYSLGVPVVGIHNTHMKVSMENIGNVMHTYRHTLSHFLISDNFIKFHGDGDDALADDFLGAVFLRGACGRHT